MCKICTGDYNEQTVSLRCIVCPNLVEIPDTLVNLERLVVSCCRNLLLFPRLPKLTVLYVFCCPSLDLRSCDFLHNLIDFTYINSGTDIDIEEFIGNLTKLEILACGSCAIPDLPRLRRLYVRENDNLIRIPDTLHNLEYLDCSYCPNLEVIPDLTSLRTVECSDCPNLLYVPKKFVDIKRYREIRKRSKEDRAYKRLAKHELLNFFPNDVAELVLRKL